jgi:dihydrofolate synthase / folylpolyglutamate synthase
VRTAAAPGVWAELLARPAGRVSHDAPHRVIELLSLLGNPHHGVPVIHVAGTNGKTTTTRAIDAVLSAAGLRVARFTSPHLQSPDERITLAGRPLSEPQLTAAYRQLAPVLERIDREAGGAVPFFTALTALALTAFAGARPDAAVIEVGIGGRDDATNAVDGQVAVICPISPDHRAQLGTSLTSIAAHKAGIVKPGARVVMAGQHPSVEAVVHRHAIARGATVVAVDRRLSLLDRRAVPGGQRLSLRGYGDSHLNLHLPLLGCHQAGNAMTAIVAAQEFLASRDETLDRDAIRTGLAKVTSPGRLERVAEDPPVIVDVTHNPAGMAVTAEAIRQGFGRRRPVAVFAAAADKDAPAMLAALAPVVGELILTSSGPRCWDPGELRPVAGRLCERVEVIGQLAPAIEQACSRTSTGVVVTGSVVTAGAARELFRPRRVPVLQE